MTRILILGATGRTGAAILKTLPAGIKAVAAVRNQSDITRLASTPASLQCVVIDITDTDSIRNAMCDIEVVVNAIRLRKTIAPTKLVALHDQLVTAGIKANGNVPQIVTVGGAGALRLPNGIRFWQTPMFPQVTLPRGRAHAVLRDHLESGDAGEEWAYLIPPPAYDPNGTTTGRWERIAPAIDETLFTTRTISYADFGSAVTETVTRKSTGTQLIAWPKAADHVH